MSASDLTMRQKLPVWVRPRRPAVNTYSAPEELPVFAPPVVAPVPAYALGEPDVEARPDAAPYSDPAASALPAYAPPDPYRDAAERLRAAQTAEVEGSRGKSAAYGAAQGGAAARGSDSLGYTLGSILGGAGAGLVNDKLYGQAKKAAEVQKLKGEVATEAALGKAERDAREQKADILNKEQLPTFKTEEQRRKDDAEKRKGEEASRRAALSVFNKLDEFDPDDPANTDFVAQMTAAGVPVIRKERGKQVTIKQDSKTGALYVVSADKTTGAGSSAAVTAPDGKGQLATTTTQQMSAEQQAERIKSAEKIAGWRIKAQKEIAAANQSIQRDRAQLSKEQFGMRYPGAGKVLTADDIAKKAQQLKMLPEDAAKQAILQGYVIQ